MKSTRWKLCAEVTFECKSKLGLCMKKNKKSIELLRAWSFYLSSSSFLSSTIRPSGYCVPQLLNIYLNLSLNSQPPTGLVTCIILMHLYFSDTPYDFKHVPTEVFASDQVRSRPIYSSSLGAISLLSKLLSFSSFWFSRRQSWNLYKREVFRCV